MRLFIKRPPTSDQPGSVNKMIELPQAQTAIAPIADLIVEAYLESWKSWRKFLEDEQGLALPFNATARANFLHCHVCSEISKRIADVAEVEETEVLEFYALKVGPEILLRFKYTRRGQPSNVKTKRQRRLDRQIYTADEALALTGDAALVVPTLLTAGYTIDGDEIGRIEIRRDCKGHPRWYYNLYGDPAVVQPLALDGMADDAKPAIVVSSRKGEREGEAASGQ
jgi:hypothetical protein